MRHLLTTTLIFFGFALSAQPPIVRLTNPSFEGEPQDATTPTGWHPCREASTPDILPGPWGVYQEASEGNTYIGLICRPDGSREGIGQRLSTPLEANECYTMQLDLAYARTYSGYNHPLRLRIWVADTRCGNQQLIYESELISHSTWKTYAFEFVTKSRYHYLILEALPPEGSVGVKGNILIDHIRAIKPCVRA
jgi:hypothetical protein